MNFKAMKKDELVGLVTELEAKVAELEAKLQDGRIAYKALLKEQKSSKWQINFTKYNNPVERKDSAMLGKVVVGMGGQVVLSDIYIWENKYGLSVSSGKMKLASKKLPKSLETEILGHVKSK